MLRFHPRAACCTASCHSREGGWPRAQASRSGLMQVMAGVFSHVMLLPLKVSQAVCCEGSCGGNAAACQKPCPGWGCCHHVPTVPTLSCAVSGASGATLPVCSPQCPAQGVADHGHSRDTVEQCAASPPAHLQLRLRLGALHLLPLLRHGPHDSPPTT